MSLQETHRDPAFCYEVRASGLAEVWTHTHDQLKFTQFGWRCSNKESGYGKQTLIGNWNEERYNIHCALEEKPLPSQHAHYFESTSSNDYSKNQKPVGIDDSSKKLELKNLAGKEATSFPGHQPELDHNSIKEIYNSFMTSSRTAYVHPNVRKTPQGVTPSVN
ncbi:cilia- and flagella-associated protein 68-like [Clavelina lepadiformis]|uniref:cilia- and flagella-associated protein 68-like n=1 Tax=Clavelina lepadiformis TaxID=159417 RepID=UPI004042B632